MKKEIISLLSKNGFKFTSNYKVMDLNGGYVGIDYNKDNDKFGIFVKRNTYFYDIKTVNEIKNELDEKLELINILNKM